MPCPLAKHTALPRRNKLKGNRAQGVQRVSWLSWRTCRCQSGAKRHGRRAAALSHFKPVCRCAGEAQTRHKACGSQPALGAEGPGPGWDSDSLPGAGWRGGETGSAEAAGGCANLLHLHRRPPAIAGEGGCRGGSRAARPPSQGRAARASRSCPWC